MEVDFLVEVGMGGDFEVEVFIDVIKGEGMRF